MDTREKLMWCAFCLVFVAWGLELFAVWSVLAAHLNRSNWIMIVLIHPAALLALIAAYANAPTGTPARAQALLATVIVIISWSQDFYLMGKIGAH
ncbi:MAG TPA: hypothetical protein VFF64_29315 [Candidatus Eremiobacteraceae bacterium]|nr:hypothetical protein [Candidatus Eremiobacteraceae bacterium]